MLIDLELLPAINQDCFVESTRCMSIPAVETLEQLNKVPDKQRSTNKRLSDLLVNILLDQGHLRAELGRIRRVSLQFLRRRKWFFLEDQR